MVHRRESTHRNADALSRLPCHQCGWTATIVPELHSYNVHIAATILQLLCFQSDESLRQKQLTDSVVGSFWLEPDQTWSVRQCRDCYSFETSKWYIVESSVNIFNSLMLPQEGCR